MRLQDCLRLAYEFSPDIRTVAYVRLTLIPQLWEYRRQQRAVATKLDGEIWKSQAQEATNAIRAAIQRLRMVK